VARKRIGLSMRLSDEPGEQGSGGVKKGDHRESRQAQRHNNNNNNRNRGQQGGGRGSMGDLLAAAMNKNKK
jgi:uncharacterized protein